jgi:hypothetical protein
MEAGRGYATIRTEFAMVETRNLEAVQRDERMLMSRLVERQGLSREEARQTVHDYREGKRVEIDPMLMEGLEAI